jgi:HAD superfamily hydrolase (TIGR01450 family)
VTWALDLDGVVWLAGRAIPGSADAISALRSAGERVVFLTNNSGPVVASHLDALARAGIQCQPADLTTSAQAAASLLPAGSRAAVVGDQGIREALAARGVKEVGPDQSPEAVVVGRTVDLDYWTLSAAAGAIRAGARFVATNTDPTFPTGDGGPPQGDEHARTGGSNGGGSGGDGQAGRAGAGDGLVPGAGAIVAFIATASGRPPEVAGKPDAAMAALVKARYGGLNVVVGDRPDTDGLFAVRVGAKFGLVLSGVTRPSDLPVKPAPDMVGTDLSALVSQALGPSAG